jgi:uncharacterized membrane protein
LLKNIISPLQSQSLGVEVVPDRFASPGEYRIPMKITAGDAKAEVALRVIITGRSKIEVGTASGLLSLTTEKGKTGNVSICVINTGSAPATDIEFFSVKPENRKLEFTPFLEICPFASK